MSEPALLLYETVQPWSGLLRRTLQPKGVSVVQEGSLASCSRRLMSGEFRLAAIEVQPVHLLPVMELAVQASRFAAPAGVMVLADSWAAPLEALLRESGVVHCEFSLRRFQRLSEVVERWLAIHTASEKQPAATAMPWPVPLADVLAHWEAEPTA